MLFTGVKFPSSFVQKKQGYITLTRMDSQRTCLKTKKNIGTGGKSREGDWKKN